MTLTQDRNIATENNKSSAPNTKEAIVEKEASHLTESNTTSDYQHHTTHILIVNPPAPDGTMWSNNHEAADWHLRKHTVWPRVSLTQIAALLMPDYQVEVVDAVAEGLSWPQFTALVSQTVPDYYISFVRISTLENDIQGIVSAKELGAKTIALGQHNIGYAQDILQRFSALDYSLFGEFELSLRELIDTLEKNLNRWSEEVAEPETWETIQNLFASSTVDWQAAWSYPGDLDKQLAKVKGLVWRSGDSVICNEARPLISNLDALPLSVHQLLPIQHHWLPVVDKSFACVMSNRGYPAIPNNEVHLNGQVNEIRLRSPESIMAELWLLYDMGMHDVHMVADVFTADAKQVIELCNMILKEELSLRWTCNSRPDFIDADLLTLMKRAGCWSICWDLETGETKSKKSWEQLHILNLARRLGIKNWGYFTIGLPGENKNSIKDTIVFAKKLPLDLAFFDLAADHPGVPFFVDISDDSSFWSSQNSSDDDDQNAKKQDTPNLNKAKRELRPQAISIWKRLKGLRNRFKSKQAF